MNSLETLLAQGQVAQAKAEAEKLLAKNPNHRDALVVMAKLALVENKVPQAEALLAKAEGQGATAETGLVRANIAAQKGQLDAALKAYQGVLAVEPNRAEAHFGKGMMLIKQDKAPQALEALSQAARLAPQNPVFRYRLGQVQLEAGQTDAGLATLREVLTLAPRFVPAYLSLSHALSAQEKLADARRVLEQGLKAVPNQPRLLASVTVLSMALRDLRTSYQAASTLAAQRPKDADAQANLAQLMLARGQIEQARHLCQTMASLGVASESLKMAEATCFESQEPPAYDKAIAAYEQGMGLAPDGWRAANNLGQLLLRVPAEPANAHLPRAVTVLEEAVRRAPDRPEPLLNLALAQARLGQEAKAKELVAKVLAMPLAEDTDLHEEATRLSKTLSKA
ncbi:MULTISPECIES: tetratricopeptide repeat protein [unclassified Corallococcus]|uniref:tetratricopeptide repeat protein n=1 Tax=unclassified Corallococcus TaxID=2685029 RepID=UPI001A8DF0C0|nr:MULTISPECIES: tetratricopeptide repeat protein [unclassified Corallococcus]MBN9681051.1 tetratricopeptide repeat protein [Corallococcus sp. NCSPR001]WAS87355.1 tetratricopeptide repeat protein [Corallococcus sp. NCRR]